jgi:type IV fimbrial biogenesis protein FimT
MLMPFYRADSGFSMIELLITVAVLGILFMVGLPSLATWMQNTQVRNSAEAVVAGLQLARNEALRRNRTVQFSLVDSLNSGCTVTTSGSSWVVSLADPTTVCEQAPSETAAPQIIQKRSAQEGSPSAVVNSNVSSVSFSGIGRLATGGVPTRISITSLSGACQDAAGPIRCLRIDVTASGSVRMCDPAVSNTADPRYCLP